MTISPKTQSAARWHLAAPRAGLHGARRLAAQHAARARGGGRVKGSWHHVAVELAEEVGGSTIQSRAVDHDARLAQHRTETRADSLQDGRRIV